MTRTFSHLTPRYIKNRLLVMWDEYRHPNSPWLTAEAVRLLDRLLKPDDIGAEFGSGRSTVWFARRLKHLTSVESDPTWFEKVNLMLAHENLAHKVDYRKFQDLAEYARQASSFPDQSLDFCLVDGEARDACALAILPKIKAGGILAVDNINWYLPNDETCSPNSKRTRDGVASDGWHTFANAVAAWRRLWTTNGVTDTCLWFKP